MRILAAVFVAALTLTGCGDTSPTSEQLQNKAQEQTNLQAVQSVGMPSITRFSEKRQLKTIFELRDAAITTTTYIVDLNGNLHKFCDSVGYGIPYATQYTNPQRPAQNYETQMAGNIALPQADPNGLYSPVDAEGTWILCNDPKTKKNWPIYVEPRVVVSPFALTSK
jgi:hypothetical protein